MLWDELRKKGARFPAKAALEALHAEMHPDGKGDIASTKRLAIIGQHEDNFISEIDVKRYNGEPLSDFEREIFRSLKRRDKNLDFIHLEILEFDHLSPCIARAYIAPQN